MEIAQLGNPVLRQRAEAVKTSEFSELQPFFADLEKTMIVHHGVGIAAPQVSESIRAFIVAPKPNSRYPNAPLMPPTLMLNPKLISQSENIEMDWEGCLSIPGIRAKVPRASEIEVSYQTLDGNTVDTQFSGFAARVFLHELDHLEGIVFLDRTDSSEYVTDAEFMRIIEADMR
ncbi:peptide deformylase [Veronia pacifica]|nr:peptide deformylase [Veronia pacifica]